MNKETLKAAQHYWNYIVPKYPDKPWRWVEARVRNKANFISYNPLEDHPRWQDNVEYRFLPETVMIGNHEVPRWFEGELEKGQEYWMVYIANGVAYAYRFIVHDLWLTKQHVKTKTVHLTKEACLLHGEAWLALPEGLKDELL